MLLELVRSHWLTLTLLGALCLVVVPTLDEAAMAVTEVTNHHGD